MINYNILRKDGDKVFGFVVANPEKLTDEQNKHYKQVYCGICEELADEGGFICRMTLAYDLVFLAVVLSSVSGEDYTLSECRCPVHPAKKRFFERNSATRYAADMNIALAYYKYLDDMNDDNSKSAFIRMKLLEKKAVEITEKYPLQCAAIVRCLDKLSETEKKGILIPDIPAGIFGELLGEIFCYGKREENKELYEFGCQLGKFIYILDAAVDLRKDIKKQRYNPLVRYAYNDTEPLLRHIMACCVESYKLLGIERDKEIIENILFSGVWTAYDARKKGKNSER